ncbi:MAG: hypothetical protein ACR2MC_05195 [Actinomycetota bacterium]
MSINPRGRATNVGRIFLMAAVVLAIAAAVILMTLPLASTVDSAGRRTFTNLLEQEGTGVISVLLIPVIITGVALLMNGSRYAYLTSLAAALLMLIGSFVAIGSIGVFYVPAAIASVTAALRRN